MSEDAIFKRLLDKYGEKRAKTIMGVRMNVDQVRRMQELLKKRIKRKDIAITLKISRPTLNNAILKYGVEAISEKSKRVEPKYIDEWDSSEVVARFKEENRKVVVDTLAGYLRAGRETWKVLNKKDPMTWTEDDFKKMWNYPPFFRKGTNEINFNNAVALRRWMEFTKNFDLLKVYDTEDLKKTGLRKGYYIQTLDDMIQVINAIQYPDTLTMFRIGTECGARISSLKLIHPADIIYSRGIIIMKETKTDQEGLERDFNQKTLEFVRRYIFDYNISGRDLIFRRSEQYYNADLKQAGKKANIAFDLTSHVGMKHTFVTQASAHSVSLEVVSEQTGTDPSTLKQFYLGIGQNKKRHELLGEPYPIETYGEWINKLDDYYRKRYEQLKTQVMWTDGFTKKKEVKPKKEEKPKSDKPHPIHWKAVDGIIASPKTPPALVPLWKDARDLHNQGFSDFEVRQRMNWKQRT